MEEYIKFVDSVTSPASKDHNTLINRLDQLNDGGLLVSRLMTASIGLCGEVGEFNDIVKKVLFQEKQYTEEVKNHLKKELGDIFWYAAQACLALEVNANDIMQMNRDKLDGRYDEGKFNAHQSENRKDGDI